MKLVKLDIKRGKAADELASKLKSNTDSVVSAKTGENRHTLIITKRLFSSFEAQIDKLGAGLLAQTMYVDTSGIEESIEKRAQVKAMTDAQKAGYLLKYLKSAGLKQAIGLTEPISPKKWIEYQGVKRALYNDEVVSVVENGA